METIINLIFKTVAVVIFAAPFICAGCLLAVTVHEIVSGIRGK